MASLRQLSAVYLLAASGFAVSIALAQHPDWAATAKLVADNLRERGGEAAVALNEEALKPGYAMARAEADDLMGSVAQLMNPAPVRVAAAKAPVAQIFRPRTIPPITAEPIGQPREPDLVQVVPALPPVETSKPAPKQVARAPLELAPEATEPPPDASAPMPALSDAELARVEQRLKDSLTGDMFDHFELFLYVSKASAGPWAQHMYVFQKAGSGFSLLYNWPVSTGRERLEDNGSGKPLSSITPTGYFELDPDRFHAHYNSSQWHHPMPHAMFFNWMTNGLQTGIAIHGVMGDDIAHLGSRASAGCVRLAPENAALLFDLIRANYKGLVPRFAYDKKTASITNDGVMMHDTDGRLQLTEGYKVLVFIENYGGGDTVAALF
ncbi:MAG TPA: L,D-transpeptidase family protein [Rhizomicrobium sp.]|nr:L,D-transpeptidase family protein [Rhizomicrobium sp.]